MALYEISNDNVDIIELENDLLLKLIMLYN